jgi:hypothetical protein
MRKTKTGRIGGYYEHDSRKEQKGVDGSKEA